MVNIDLIGIIVISISGAFSAGVMIAMCACQRKVIKDMSSSEDLNALFPEVNVSREDN